MKIIKQQKTYHPQEVLFWKDPNTGEVTLQMERESSVPARNL